MFTIVAFLCFIYIFCVTVTAIPGGWEKINNPNSVQDVLSEAQWAGGKIFPGKSFQLTVVSAQRQVVAGLNYRYTFVM